MKNSGSTAFAYSMLLPAFLVVAIFLVYPLYMALNFSFRQGVTMNFSQVANAPFSIQNYLDIFSDVVTWHDLWISILYTIISTVAAFLVGLAIALLLNRQFIGRRWLRTLILIPWAVPGVVTILGFIWVLDASYGVFNYLLHSLGLISNYISWFSDPQFALIAVILPTVWKGYPFFTLMLLASLQSIPLDLYEAGRVDGASKIRLFRWITWPGIKSTAMLSLVLNGLWVFREFDFIYPSTGGGPNGATETLAIRIYNQAFSFFHMGTASALGIMTLLICVAAVISAYPIIKDDFFGGKK